MEEMNTKQRSDRSVAAWHKIILMISFAAIKCLTWNPRSDLIMHFLQSLVTCWSIILLLPASMTRLSRDPKPNWWQILAGFMFTCYYGITFYSNLIAHRHLKALIARLGIWWTVMVITVDLIGILVSLPLQWKILHLTRFLKDKIEQAARDHAQKCGPVPMKWMKYILITVIVIFDFYLLQYSLLLFPDVLFSMKPKYLLTFFAILFATYLVLALIFQRWRLTMLIGNIFFSVWSVGNYYVYLLHGSPLYFSELANVRTAMDVIHDYTVSITQVPWDVLGLAVLSFVVAHVLWIVDREYRAFSWKTVVARVCAVAVLICPIYSNLVKKSSDKIIGALPTYYASSYGFGCMAVYEVARTMNPIIMPEGYSPDKLPAPTVTYAEVDGEAPDIILIINETFCDLDYYTSVEADRDYMAPFYGIENAFYGHALSPVIGGGTNNTEYETLTGLPYYLVTAYAPFNYLNFRNINCNAAQYFSRLGYHTEAGHYFSKVNYHRSTAYPAMGFDRYLLGPPDNLSTEMNGVREHLDKSYYDVLEQEYELVSQEGSPQFSYLLTYQNHGGYKRNSAEFDTVHTGANFGLYSEEVNEYISSVSLSATAFVELTEYFSKVDRPVIICMVGDHAPNFITMLPTDRDLTKLETEIAQRVVPYVVWSNYGLDLSGCRKYVNMYTLLPQLLSVAGLPVTQFYQTVLNEQVPGFFNDGLYLDADGNTGKYDVNDPRFDIITQYLYMSYNALNGCDEEDYIEEMFLPQPTAE